MANYDKATEDFIRNVIDETPRKPSQDGAQLAKQVIRAVASPKLIPKMIATQAIRKSFEKEASEVSQFKPLGIYNMLMREYKKDWFEWEADVLREEIPNQEEGFYEMVQALQTIVKTDFPYEMWHVFENVGHAINGNPVMVNHITPLEIDECALMVKVVDSIRPNLEETDEICAYIAACAMDAGLVLLPPTIFDKRCQEELDDLNMDLSIKEKTLAALNSGKAEDEVVKMQIDKIKDILDYVRDSLGA